MKSNTNIETYVLDGKHAIDAIINVRERTVQCKMYTEHFCCKTYFDASEDWEITRRLLGHSAASVTQKYYYTLDTDDLTRYAKKIDQKIDQNKRKAT